MKYEHGGNKVSLARSLQIQADTILDASANINPNTKPAWIQDVVLKSISEFSNYPDITYHELISSIAKYENIREEHILLGNGASPLFFDFMHILKPKIATLITPTFSEYEQALCSVQADIEYHNGFQSVENLTSQLSSKSDVLFLCNPNNPTGQLYKRSFIEQILQEHPTMKVIVDESFMDFTDTKESCIPIYEKYANLIIIKSYTKFFQCPGLRIGIAITSDSGLLSKHKLTTPPWQINAVINALLSHYLHDTSFIETSKQQIQIWKDEVYQGLCSLGFKVWNPTANYVFFQSEVEDLQERCLKQGLLIRDCSNYHNAKKGMYRICVFQHDENIRMLEMIKKAIQE